MRKVAIRSRMYGIFNSEYSQVCTRVAIDGDLEEGKLKMMHIQLAITVDNFERVEVENTDHSTVNRFEIKYP